MCRPACRIQDLQPTRVRDEFLPILVVVGLSGVGVAVGSLLNIEIVPGRGADVIEGVQAVEQIRSVLRRAVQDTVENGDRLFPDRNCGRNRKLRFRAVSVFGRGRSCRCLDRKSVV